MNLSLSVGALSPRTRETPRSEALEHAKPRLHDQGDWEYLGEYSSAMKESPLIAFVGVDTEAGATVVLVRTSPEQSATPLSARTDDRIKTIANLSYRALVRNATRDYVGYLNFSRDKAIKLTSAGLLKALKKQLPFLEHAPVLTEIDFSPVRAAFEEMDAALLNATAKLSVVRVRPRQTAEGPILENEEGAGEFHHFLGLLGDRVALKGWAAYAANLNTTDNSHGSHSIYTRMGNFEVMFHVAPLIAYTSDKQLERKRFIGNNISIILFLDHGAELSENPFVSQFCHNAVIVQPVDAAMAAFNVQFLFRDGQKALPKCGNNCVLTTGELRQFLLAKMINEERALMQRDKTLRELYGQIRESQVQRFLKAVKGADAAARAPKKRDAVLHVPKETGSALARVRSDVTSQSSGQAGADVLGVEASLRPRDWELLMLNCTTFALRKGDAPPSTMQAARNYYRVASGDVRLDDVSSLGSAVLTAGFDFGERSLFCPQPVAVRCVSAAAEVQAPDATVMAAALCELGLSLRFLRHFAAKFGRRYLLSLGHLRSAFRMPEEIALPRQRPDAEANDLALRDVFALPDEACLRAFPCKRSGIAEAVGTLLLTPKHLCFLSKEKGSQIKKKVPLPLSETTVERDREKITVIHASKKTSYVLPTRLQADEFYAAHCILTRTPFPPPFSPTPLLRIFLEKKPPLFTLETADWTALSSNAWHNSFKAGAVVLNEAKFVDRLYWIHAGQCRVHSSVLRSSVPTPSHNAPAPDQHAIVTSLQTGQFFAEAEFLMGCEAAHSVIAASTVEVHSLGTEELKTLSGRDPLLLQRLYLFVLYGLLEKLRASEAANEQHAHAHPPKP